MISIQQKNFHGKIKIIIPQVLWKYWGAHSNQISEKSYLNWGRLFDLKKVDWRTKTTDGSASNKLRYISSGAQKIVKKTASSQCCKLCCRFTTLKRKCHFDDCMLAFRLLGVLTISTDLMLISIRFDLCWLSPHSGDDLHFVAGVQLGCIRLGQEFVLWYMIRYFTLLFV